jgi:hypothetical protein
VLNRLEFVKNSVWDLGARSARDGGGPTVNVRWASRMGQGRPDGA